MALNSANQVACIELGRNKISDFGSNTVSAIPSSKKNYILLIIKKLILKQLLQINVENLREENLKVLEI